MRDRLRETVDPAVHNHDHRRGLHGDGSMEKTGQYLSFLRVCVHIERSFVDWIARALDSIEKHGMYIHVSVCVCARARVAELSRNGTRIAVIAINNNSRVSESRKIRRARARLFSQRFQSKARKEEGQDYRNRDNFVRAIDTFDNVVRKVSHDNSDYGDV